LGVELPNFSKSCFLIEGPTLSRFFKSLINIFGFLYFLLFLSAFLRKIFDSFLLSQIDLKESSFDKVLVFPFLNILSMLI
jgi:hypothetical protein